MYLKKHKNIFDIKRSSRKGLQSAAFAKLLYKQILWKAKTLQCVTFLQIPNKSEHNLYNI